MIKFSSNIFDFDDIKSIILDGQEEIDNYFPHQIEIMKEINNNEDKNIIIQAPTSSGKTLAISPLIYNEFQLRKRLVYAVPSKAMRFDKLDELKGYFRGFKIRPVIKMIGSDYGVKEADIIIGTFEEIYTGTLRQKMLNFFDTIILDDFHILYGETRGYTLEKLITFILTNYKMRIIALSATIAPLDLLAKWLKDALILKYNEDVRPVKLKHEILDINDSNNIMKINNKPMLVFCSTKNWTMSRAKIVKEKLMKQGLTRTRYDKNEIAKLHRMDRADFDADEEELLTLMEYGVAYHHGSLESQTKYWIEKVFKEKMIDYLFATTTLAYGINLPAKSVVINDLKRWTNRGMDWIPKYEWEQMIGRAGRTGKQEEGYVYSCFKNEKGKEQILNKYHNGEIENVESSIEHDDCLKKALLDIISVKKGTQKEILDFFRNSFFMAKENEEKEGAFGFQFDLEEMIAKHIGSLIDMGYIERKIPKRFVLTDFGSSTVDFLQKTFGDYNLKALRRLRDGLNDDKKITITPKEVLEVSIELSALSESDYSPVRLYPSVPNLEFLDSQEPGKKFNTASATSYVVLNGWLENITDDEIFRRFDGKWATYVKTINNTIADLLDFSKILLSYSKTKVDGNLDQFIKQVRLGVTANMLNFRQIKGFGRKTTILTYQYFKHDSIYAGLPEEFKKAFDNDILKAFKKIDKKLLITYLSAIPQIGVSRANKIFENIDEEWSDSLEKTFLSESRKHRGSEPVL